MLSTLIDIAGVPGLDLALDSATELASAVQNIKVYRVGALDSHAYGLFDIILQGQCKDLSDKCATLLITFSEKCHGLEGLEVVAAADEITCIIERARKKALVWSSWNRIKSLVNQGDIKLGLEQLYRDLDHCDRQFSIITGTETIRNQREQNLIHERDVADNREILQNILQSVDGLRDVISDSSAVRPFMQTIQEELQQQTVRPEQSRELQQGLYEIHRRTKVLPPMIDLTGQIQKTGKAPSAYGAYNDVYTGLWLGEEKVALKFARAINHTPKARKRFHKEVEIWRDLQHPHVSRLYGIVYLEDQIYSVSKWMECGSALEYISSTDKVINRLGILGDVASGMEYLHKRGVVHGDLRAANILIGDDGRACVSDFGLSQVIEEVAPDMSSSNNGDSPVRWQAPELVKPDDDDGPVHASTSTDVWSFGMICLEIMTGKKPYHHRIRDSNVISDLLSRRLPDRPNEEEVVKRGLSDQMWNLMLHCWNWEPLERPSMANVKLAVRSLPLHSSPGLIPIIGASLSESPKPLTKELPQIPTKSAAIPVPSRSSLSPGIGASLRTPPSPSPLWSTPPKSFTPPRKDSLNNATRPILGRVTPSSASSGTSSSFNVPQPFGSNSASRHRQSMSGQSHQVPTKRISTGIGIAGPRKSSESSFQDQRGTTLGTVDSSRQPSSPLPDVRNGSFPTILSEGEASSLGLSSISSSSPSANDLLNTPPRERASAPSGLSLTNPLYTPPVVSPKPLLRANVENNEENESLFNFRDSFSEYMRPFSEDIRIHPPTVSNTSAPQLAQPGLYKRHSEGEQLLISSSLPSSDDSAFSHNRRFSLSDAIPPKSPLLDFNDLNLSVYVRDNKDGTVKSASLAGLVDQLLKSTTDGANHTKVHKFRDAFLTTHRLFASTTNVLKLILYRFIVASSDQNMPVEERVEIRYMVLSVLGQWLKGHYADALEIHHLEDLRAFLQEITSPPAFSNSARDLINTVDTLLSVHANRATSPTSSYSGSKSSVRASEISSQGLAIALTILEGEKYRAISATDCVTYLLHKDDPDGFASGNRVGQARATNNTIVNWVKKSIIRSDKLESRQETLRFFVRTAIECREIHNYSSMSALIAGLDSVTVSRLKLTNGCLDKNMRKTRKELSALLDPSHNHRAYRDALSQRGKTSCLPCLAVHLKDSQGVYERHPTRVPLGEQSLINFEKFLHLYDSILAVLAFQERANKTLAYNSEAVEHKLGPLLYLEEQLTNTHLGPALEKKLEERSLEVQKKEDRDYEARVPEIIAVGFDASRGRG